jgi:hypothetical protein
MSSSGLTPTVGGRQRSAMVAFPVPRYLVETARRHHGVAQWILGLSAIVAGLAGRWSLQTPDELPPGHDALGRRIAAGPRRGEVVDVHPAGLNSFQCPSEMTSTLPPVTLMAV